MKLKIFVSRHPVAIYFVATFILSWSGAFILVAPEVLGGKPLTKINGLLMFPIMILCPTTVTICLTAITDGKAGLKYLWQRLTIWKVPFKWYALALFTPPVLVLLALLFLKNFVSPDFTPNFFPIGILFGIPAGFFEEIGWTGYAFDKLRLKHTIIKSGAVIGILWGLWHFPVIDFLGAAFPHGKYLLFFFIAFIAIMMAMRFLIIWVYSNTNSLLLAQVLHVISTGSLVVFGPPKVSPAQEALWYAAYAVILWIFVLIIFRTGQGKKKDSIPS